MTLIINGILFPGNTAYLNWFKLEMPEKFFLLFDEVAVPTDCESLLYELFFDNLFPFSLFTFARPSEMNGIPFYEN